MSPNRRKIANESTGSNRRAPYVVLLGASILRLTSTLRLGAQSTQPDWHSAPTGAFAYKLSITQARLLDSELPKWALAYRFDIQARATADATKDRMRLMMQSLLADRFQLKAHFEMRETKIYAIELVRAGATGPKLQPHTEDPPCPDASTPFHLRMDR